MSDKKISTSKEDFNIDWLLKGGKREEVRFCPICRSTSRSILHNRLKDDTFNSNKDTWTLNRCDSCSSAYLAPRPSPETIYLAYENYYTHDIKDCKNKSLVGMRKIKRILANGYKNWKYGSNISPSSYMGVIIAYLFPSARASMNKEMRHLPKLFKGAKLLDVGFGDGIFLQTAKQIGWDVKGVDFDPNVVANAKKNGLDVFCGGVEIFIGQENKFDVITMSHVIEHVYDPVSTLKICFSLLKPGGQLWIETPNINSYGYKNFGQNWRGIEAPRHLTIFTNKSLDSLLCLLGFRIVKHLNQPNIYRSIYIQSKKISEGINPYAEGPNLTVMENIHIAMVDISERLFKSKREFITIKAIK